MIPDSTKHNPNPAYLRGLVERSGLCQQDQCCEWSASVPVGESILVVYYYTTNDEDDRIAGASDGSTIDWVPNGYEII